MISQVYPPDPTSLGQHMQDAASELARRGDVVTVLTADRGYADPELRYPRAEVMNGVDVRRLALSSFGKRTLVFRLLGGLSFLVQAVVRGLRLPTPDIVLVSTSPPMAGVVGWLLSRLTGAQLVYWVMDLNPDQAVALGMFGPSSLPVRLFGALNRLVFRHARAIVVTDRFMASRILARGASADKLHVLPPWPNMDEVRPTPREENPFRAAHGLQDRFVVMYSGNHTMANPLDTIIEAARALQDDKRLVFMFIGGGEAKELVEAAKLSNIISLPYQPIDQLPFSLGAADLHVVTMGDAMVGIVHACKVYGAFATGRPILFIGPAECHITDMLGLTGAGWRVAHGDVDGAVAAIRDAASRRDVLDEMGSRGRDLIQERFSRQALRAAFCDVVENTARTDASASAAVSR